MLIAWTGVYSIAVSIRGMITAQAPRHLDMGGLGGIGDFVDPAEKIASKSSMTVSIGKKAFYAQAEMNLSEAYKYTSQVMKDNLLNDDAKEGIDAFIEKRSPNWKDK